MADENDIIGSASEFIKGLFACSYASDHSPSDYLHLPTADIIVTFKVLNLSFVYLFRSVVLCNITVETQINRPHTLLLRR